jgi:flagellar protein FliT
MLLMPTQISLYEEMSALSAQMVDAARANDWDGLVSLERSVAVLREALQKDEDNGNLSEAEREMKTRLIQRILEDDAEIRRHTEPQMEQVRKFLGNAAMKHRVERAYGAT